MTKQWSMREYREGDEKGILELYKEVFGTEVSAESWQWRYKQNPAGQAVIVITESDQGIVGHYALIPLRMKTEEGMCAGSYSLEAFVHADYRGQGLMTTIARQVYKLAAERGIHFLFGFLNENSHYLFPTKLNWITPYDGIPLWAKPLNFESIIKKRFINNELVARLGGQASKMAMGLLNRSRRSTPMSSIQERENFDHRFDSLWDEASRSHNITVIRDRQYLTWRYVEKPDDSYTILTAEREDRLLGYVILKCIPRFGLQIGFIIDLLTVPEELQVSRDLVSAAVKYFELRRMDMVGCLMMPSTSYSFCLREAGFIKVPKRLSPQAMYFGCASLISPPDSVSLADPSNWFITWGDHDSV